MGILLRLNTPELFPNVWSKFGPVNGGKVGTLVRIHVSKLSCNCLQKQKPWSKLQLSFSWSESRNTEGQNSFGSVWKLWDGGPSYWTGWRCLLQHRRPWTQIDRWHHQRWTLQSPGCSAATPSQEEKDLRAQLQSHQKLVNRSRGSGKISLYVRNKPWYGNTDLLPTSTTPDGTQLTHKPIHFFTFFFLLRA